MRLTERRGRSAIGNAAVMSALFAVGCAGASADVSFSGVQYPMSMSYCVPDEDGRHLGMSDLEDLGDLDVDGRAFGVGWSSISLGDVDVSGQINEQVEKAGGEAVVGLEVSVSQSPWNLFWPPSWLPVFPGTAPVEIAGLIVRRRAGDRRILGCLLSMLDFNRNGLLDESDFSMLDDSADGHLQRDEVFPEGAWSRLEEADADGDGAISPDEFAGARAAAASLQESEFEEAD